MTAVIDHLVFAARSLDEGAPWLEERLGVSLAPGGQHAKIGTHNRLLRLGDKLYLELIAIDPDLPTPDRPRWFSLDEPDMQRSLHDGPRLITWAARCDDIEAASAKAPELGTVEPMTRGALDWRITVPADGRLAEDGLLPALIQWNGKHPADSMLSSGVTLASLRLRARKPERISGTLTALGFDEVEARAMTEPSSQPELAVTLNTPNGLASFSSVPIAKFT